MTCLTGPFRRRCRLVGSMVVLFAACIAAAGIAVAQEGLPFTGRWQWDGPETCAKGYDSDNVAMLVEPRRLVFYESVCRVRSMHRFDGNSFRLRLLCRGEGQTWRTNTMLTVLRKSKVSEELLLRVELDDGHVTAYRRCP